MHRLLGRGRGRGYEWLNDSKQAECYPLALTGMKAGAPLLQCSINDTLIDRVSCCQNAFMMLTDVFDLFCVTHTTHVISV